MIDGSKIWKIKTRAYSQNTQKEYASDRDLLPKGNTHTPDPRNGKAKNYEIDEQICNSAPFIEKG